MNIFTLIVLAGAWWGADSVHQPLRAVQGPSGRELEVSSASPSRPASGNAKLRRRTAAPERAGERRRPERAARTVEPRRPDHSRRLRLAADPRREPPAARRLRSEPAPGRPRSRAQVRAETNRAKSATRSRVN